MVRIAFVTQATAPDVSTDDALAVAALAQSGIEVSPVPWDDSAADWTGFEAVVLRSCWNYYLRVDSFTAWLQGLVRKAVRVINPPNAVFETIDKRYLLRLAASGLPVVASRYVPVCTQQSLGNAIQALGISQWVVKPAVAAEGYGAFRGTSFVTTRLWSAIAPTLAGRAVLVQPYYASIESTGELSLVYFHGTFSHAVRKHPGPGDFRVQASFEGTACAALADWDCIELGTRTLEETWIGQPPFARVDLVRGEDGWVIMEVELIEPRLYLSSTPAAPNRFSAALVQSLADFRRSYTKSSASGKRAGTPDLP